MPAPGVVETYEPGVQLRREQPRRQRISRISLVVIVVALIARIALIVREGHADLPVWMIVIGYLIMCCSFAMSSRPFVIDAGGIHLPSRIRTIPWKEVAAVRPGNRFENRVWLTLCNGKDVALPLSCEKVPAVEALFAAYGPGHPADG